MKLQSLACRQGAAVVAKPNIWFTQQVWNSGLFAFFVSWSLSYFPTYLLLPDRVAQRMRAMRRQRRNGRLRLQRVKGKKEEKKDAKAAKSEEKKDEKEEERKRKSQVQDEDSTKPVVALYIFWCWNNAMFLIWCCDSACFDVFATSAIASCFWYGAVIAPVLIWSS